MTPVGASWWGRIRPLLREAFWPTVFFLIVAVVAEISLHVYYPPPEPKPYHTSMYTHDGRPVSYTEGPVQLELSTDTFYRSRPNQSLPHLNINSMGLRGGEIAAKGERIRVLVLGASTAFGVGAENDADTFVARMEALHPGVETINGAVIGFVVTQQLTFLSSELLALEPDIIITVDSYADIFDAWYGQVIGGKQKPAYQHTYNTLILPQVESQLVDHYALERSVLGSLGHSVGLILNQSRLWTSLQSKVDELRARIAASQETSTPTVLMDDAYYEQILETYVEALLRIHRIGEAYGAKHFAVLQPDLGLKQPHTTDEVQFMGEINSMVPGYSEGYVPTFERFTLDAEARLRAAGIPVLNSNSRDALMRNEETMFVDMAHLSSAGHAVFADLLIEGLIQQELIPPAR